MDISDLLRIEEIKQTRLRKRRLRFVAQSVKWGAEVIVTLVTLALAAVSQWVSYGFNRGIAGGGVAAGSLIGAVWVVSQSVSADIQTTVAIASVFITASVAVDHWINPFDKLRATDPTMEDSHSSSVGGERSTSVSQSEAVEGEAMPVADASTEPTGNRSRRNDNRNDVMSNNDNSEEQTGETDTKTGIDASQFDPDKQDDDAGADDEGREDSVLTSEFFQTPPEIDFADVAGMEDVKEELRTRVIEPLANPEKYEKYGLSVENGFLFHGPPGTGKTYISKALAGELDIEYAQVKGTDLISRYVGAGAENVGELFKEARGHQPCMVFIDEIDAVATNRKESGQHQMQAQMVNQLLEEIGELNDSDEDIIVVGATNRLERLDDAVLRSGRLSEHIKIGKPDADSRIGILDTHLDAPRDDDLDLTVFRDESDGLNAADMEQVAVNAAREAMLREDVVKPQDIETGIDQVR